MTCTQCGAQNPDNGAFCVGCGQPLAAPQAQQYAPQPQQYAPPPPQQFPQYAAPAAPADDEAKDAADNKVMGILAYCGPLALIPFLTKKDSPFAQYHAKQGMTLLVVWVGYFILNWLLRLIKVTRTVTSVWGLPIESRVTPWFIVLITTLLSLAICILAILGIISAVKGEKKELPLIGSIKIFK